MKQIRREILVVVLCKLIALFLIWACFFSHPDDVQFSLRKIPYSKTNNYKSAYQNATKNSCLAWKKLAIQ